MLKQVQHDGAVWGAIFALLMLLCAFPAVAQTIPPLTGRVVDTAGLLDPAQKAALETKLEGIEKTTGHQLVVATVPDLKGYPVESVGIKMLRDWQIGDKTRDDGVILLIAKNDRKLRIEVGYGLEPQLTDAWSSLIINNTITPRFRAGDFPGGIDAGVDAIAEQIKLTPEDAAKRTTDLAKAERSDKRGVNPGAFIFWIVIFFAVILPLVGAMSRGGRGRRHSSGLGEAIMWTAINAAINSRSDGGGSSWGGGGGGDWGGGGGGGFSGGGGSGGGGGASGGW